MSTTSKKTIYLDAPNLGNLERSYIDKALEAGYVSSVGPLIAKFEETFAKYLGVKGAVSTQSGTAALHITLHECGIGKGDEVIVPILTFVATVNPILYTRAKPIFVDVNPDTWNIDPNAIERAITKKTKAIIPVHLYGNPCDMDSILHIAKRYKLLVIEDATESLGAYYKGRPTGTFGDFGCFSFNGNKIITTGGGGMVVGNDIARLKHIKFLVNQARDELENGYHPEIGFNYRMTNIEAALGLAQMERLEGFLKKKHIFHDIYVKELNPIESIRLQEEQRYGKSSWWMDCTLFDCDIDILNLKDRLGTKGIPSRRVFAPMTEFPPYSGGDRRRYHNSYDIYARGLCLPGSTLNDPDDIRYVCKRLKEAIR